MVHLDLKGLPPRPERLLSWLRLVAACGYNAVLVEWEDQFPWTVDTAFRSRTCYSQDTVRALVAEAERLGLELIPLVQCLGHLEFVLRHDRYAPLREQPNGIDVINPLAPRAGDLLLAMIDDVLSLMPATRRFHLGGDEAWAFGTHADTRAFIAEHGKSSLYLKHVAPLLDRLHARGIRPMLWHDMMIGWDAGALRELGRHADLVVWGYRGDPATTSGHHQVSHIRRFAEADVPLWGAAAFRGAETIDSHLPDPAERECNALGWVRTAIAFGMRGVIATGWSRFSAGRVQCDPNDAALDCMALVGAILHDGCPPPGGIVACREWVVEQDPLFAEVHPAVVELAACIDSGWRQRRLWDQQTWLSSHHPDRDVVLPLAHLARRNRQWRTRMIAAAEQAARALSQGVDATWVTEYIDSCTRPLLQSLQVTAPEKAASPPLDSGGSDEAAPA